MTTPRLEILPSSVAPENNLLVNSARTCRLLPTSLLPSLLSLGVTL